MAYYDTIALGYNELHSEEQLRKLRIIANELKPRHGQWLLDVGCGTGLSGGVFSKFGCEVVGVEPSKELAKLAKFKVFNAKAESLPLSSSSFDFVICVTALHNFENPAKGLKEMNRVAKADAKFAITILKKSPKADALRALIAKTFKISREIEESKDIIFIAGKI
jgi:ubiquinone/menaquinone biosynthesis C-methylase UbiE